MYKHKKNMYLFIPFIPFTFAALTTDWFTDENIRTINGKIPLTSCPQGHYRLLKNKKYVSNREEGCIPCSRGKFGPNIGSESINSCISCPRGKYSNTLGLTSIEDCQDCPYDTYTKYYDNNVECTQCPIGKYNPNVGSYSIDNCIDCPVGYYDYQCSLLFQTDSIESNEQQQGSQHKIIYFDINTEKNCGGGLRNVCKKTHISII